MLDLHRLAIERSLAFHREIAERLKRDPAILQRARERVRIWIEENPNPHYVRRWAEILQGTPESVAAFLGNDSELARELRQSSPFAGVLSPKERWRIWRATRESHTAKS